MTTARALPLLALSATLMTACGATRTAPPPQARPAAHATGQDLVVLLPDPGSGRVGRATVSSAGTTVTLAAARDATTVSGAQAPGVVTTLGEDDVERLFGSALASMPLPPRHFTLYFNFESEELTEQSRALLREVLQAVKERPVPDVVVVGHTDTTGARSANVALGLRRANTVRAILVDTGVDTSAIEVTSHGEAQLLVPTRDNVYQARNRRVDIAVR